VHELSPLHVDTKELVYYKGEESSKLYFIQEGRVNLSIDAKDFLVDTNLILLSTEINAYKSKAAAERGEDMRKYEEDSIKKIIAYTQGGYFGDSEMFLEIPTSRDSTAKGDIRRESIIFVMKLH
jgi:CRP-like cAMP-binding protein